MPTRREAMVALGRLATLVPPRARHDLEVIGKQMGTTLTEAERAAAGYTTTEARDRLDLSLPTVHAWVRAGLLPTINKPSEETLIARKAADELAAAIQEIRKGGPRKHLLRDVAEWLETHRLVQANPELPARARRGGGRRVHWREAVRRTWGERKQASR